ncbi:MAG TPA: hypothetical protein VEX69_05280 [Candidatus Limnocylindria bacterium]|nr:hypothetical protein [Candidatus Limnocylindria bacterium]
MTTTSSRKSAALVSILFSCALIFFSANTSSAGGDGDRIHWKQLTGAQLKIDGKPPLTWNVYVPEKSHKKSNLVLVLLGHRYLAIDFKAKLVYQVLLTDLQPQGNDFESGDLFREDRVVPSEAWTMRDVGRAERITFTMKDYGRAVEVLLPHTPDLRAFY